MPAPTALFPCGSGYENPGDANVPLGLAGGTGLMSRVRCCSGIRGVSCVVKDSIGIVSLKLEIRQGCLLSYLFKNTALG